jgi:hypothetical protein
MAASLFILVRMDVSLNDSRISLLHRLFSEPIISAISYAWRTYVTYHRSVSRIQLPIRFIGKEVRT